MNSNPEFRNNIIGIASITVGMLIFAMMDSVAKWLVVNDLSPIQVIALRSIMIVPGILLTLWFTGKLHKIKTARKREHAVRGVAGFLAPFCFFTGLKTLPLADATVVFFSSIFIITILSAVILKEQVGQHRWIAVVVGFVGVMIAMQPQGDGRWGDYIMVLFGAMSYSYIFLTGKHLSKTESVISMVFSFNLMLGIVGLLLLPFIWVPMTPKIWGVLVVMAVLATAGHYALTNAFSYAPASLVVPFEYSALIWATLIGYVFWQDIPSFNVWLGAFIIVGCGVYIVHRETRLAKSNIKSVKTGL